MVPVSSVQLMIYLACVGGFTAAAAINDLRFRKIPNKLTLPFFVGGLVYQLVFNGIGDGVGSRGLIDALAAFGVGFGVLWMLWMIGGGGGGDVKLMGALSVWLGFNLTCFVMVLSVVFVMVGSVGQIAVGAISKGLFRTKAVCLVPNVTSGGLSSSVDADSPPRKRRMMSFAPPVALATWLVVLWKMTTFRGV